MSALIAPLLLALALTGTANPPSLEEVLARTAKSVERFWQEFAAVNCTESLTQEKLGKDGKIAFRHDAIFDYLILLDLQGNDLSVEESRIQQKETGKSSTPPLLTTSGFSTLLLVFHPYYQSSFEYERLEDESVGGELLSKVAFRHIHGTRSTSVLRLGDRDYPLDIEGTAWIDPAKGVIEKIETRLESPMEDLNLRSFTASVRYAPKHFETAGDAEWLPAEATIDVETARQHWRNIHRFSDYKRFTVKSETKVNK